MSQVAQGNPIPPAAKIPRHMKKYRNKQFDSVPIPVYQGIVYALLGLRIPALSASRPPSTNSTTDSSHKHASLEALRSVLNFALTCRTFAQAALPIIWRDVYFAIAVWVSYPDSAFYFRAALPQLARRVVEGARSPVELLRAASFRGSLPPQVEKEDPELVKFFPERSGSSAAAICRQQGYLFSKEQFKFASVTIEIQDDTRSIHEMPPILFEKTRMDKKNLIFKTMRLWKRLQQAPDVNVIINDSFSTPVSPGLTRRAVYLLGLNNSTVKNVALRLPLSTGAHLSELSPVYEKLTDLTLELQGRHCVTEILGFIEKLSNLRRFHISFINMLRCINPLHTLEKDENDLTQFFTRDVLPIKDFGFYSTELCIAALPPRATRVTLRADNTKLYSKAMANSDDLFDEGGAYPLVKHLSLTEYGDVMGKEVPPTPSLFSSSSGDEEQLRFPFGNLETLEINNFLCADNPQHQRLLRMALTASHGLRHLRCLYLDWALLRLIPEHDVKLQSLAIMRSLPMDLAPGEPVTHRQQVSAQKASLHPTVGRKTNVSGGIGAEGFLSASPLNPVTLDFEASAPDAQALQVLGAMSELKELVLSVRADVYVLTEIHHVAKELHPQGMLLVKADRTLPIVNAQLSADDEYSAAFAHVANQGSAESIARYINRHGKRGIEEEGSEGVEGREGEPDLQATKDKKKVEVEMNVAGKRGERKKDSGELYVFGRASGRSPETVYFDDAATDFGTQFVAPERYAFPHVKFSERKYVGSVAKMGIAEYFQETVSTQMFPYVLYEPEVLQK